MTWLRALKMGGGLALINFIVAQYVLFVKEVGHHDPVIALLALIFIAASLLLVISGWKNQTMREFWDGLFHK